jgi:ubiquinone/menaquinone biosynthesis C-methylase UbiE
MTTDRDKRLQLEYFSGVKYRDPNDAVVRAYADPKIDFIRQHVSLAGSVLDLGCGNGVFTERLASGGAIVTGLDFSPYLLSQNANPRVVCGDATCLPFPDASFDVVFEANLLHHVQDPTVVLSEMHRVTRKYVVVLEPNRYNPLMFAFSIIVRAERGGLRSCSKRLQRDLKGVGLRPLAVLTTGMISQNNTPEVLVAILRRFDRQIWWGEYIVLIAEKSAE